MALLARAAALASLLGLAAAEYVSVSNCRVQHWCGMDNGAGCGEDTCLGLLQTAISELQGSFGSNNPEADFPEGQTLCSLAVQTIATKCDVCSTCDDSLAQDPTATVRLIDATVPAASPKSRASLPVAAFACVLVASACAVLAVAIRRGRVAATSGEVRSVLSAEPQEASGAPLADEGAAGTSE